MSIQTRIEKIDKECDGVWSQYGVTSWEQTFLNSIKTRAYLTEKQEDILRGIERKVFDDPKE